MDFDNIIVNIAPLLKGQDLVFFSRVNKMYYNISNNIIKHKTLLENVDEWMGITKIMYSSVLESSVNIDKFFNFEVSDTYTIKPSSFRNAIEIKYKNLSIRLFKNKSMTVYGPYTKNINDYIDNLFNKKNCLNKIIIKIVNAKFLIPKVTKCFMKTYYPEVIYEKKRYILNYNKFYLCEIYKTNGLIEIASFNLESCFDFYKEINTHYNNYINNINTLLYKSIYM